VLHRHGGLQMADQDVFVNVVGGRRGDAAPPAGSPDGSVPAPPPRGAGWTSSSDPPAVGLEQNRLAILLAVLHRHGGLQMADQDVFVNVASPKTTRSCGSGRSRRLETIASSSARSALVSVTFTPSGQERISEAAKHGFRRAIVPAANVPKKVPEGMQIFALWRFLNSQMTTSLISF
jgi:predicted ATP-dependent serine protease